MPLIRSRNNENNRWKRKQKKQKEIKTENTKQGWEGGGGVGRSYSERIRAKWFCCAFNLGYLKLNVKLF